MHIQHLRGLLTRGPAAGRAGPDLCFNPGLIPEGEGYLLFYRVQSRHEPFTRLMVAGLDRSFHPVSLPREIEVPLISSEITSIEDPRAFRWRGEIWLMHNQASFTNGIWSTSLAIGRYDDGRISQISVPRHGQNENRALDPTKPPAFEKNWTPLVLGDDLYLIYEINPLTRLKYHPDQDLWQVEGGPGEKIATGWPGYLSGSTPLIPWRGDEYLAMFHSYQREGERRIYTAGFWSLDTRTWRVSALSPAPVLSGWKNRWLDRREGRRRFLSYDPMFQVVFPAGIIRNEAGVAVSFGWNDGRCCIAQFSEEEVSASLQPPPG